MTNISGTYIIQWQWNLYWLLNTLDKTKEVINKDKLTLFLAPIFNIEKIKYIFDELQDGKKVLVDFDNKKAKLILQKEKPYENYLLNYLNSAKIEEDYLEDKYNSFE